uniref:Sigma-54-dependent Fis family transcriptional regulator n=1 Tax=candidate division WOR-3 bacterium TaxID=2052148 RepID=A0A7C3Z3Z3_UNCW3
MFNKFRPKILVVDDDINWRNILIDVLTSEGYQTIPAGDGEEAIKKVRDNELNLVLLDLILPDINGLEVLKRIKEEKPDLVVIMITGFGTIKDAVSAIKIGAYDFFEKPSDREKILLTIRNALEKERMQREIALLREEALKKYQMVGVSEPIKKIFALIDDIAKTNATVLITGESGVGKELVARAIHNKSNRQREPFVKINCAAIPENLIESELFGYEKGAFTDAKTQKKGKLETADKGTLLLDEIGDLGLPAQAKLLRFLQEGEFERLGGNETIKVGVRIITATNKNLLNEIEKKRFREDLYFRLNQIPIYIPPLRERVEDIPYLADYFLTKYCEEYGVPKKILTPQALDYLKNQPWKGNIRELENLIIRAVLLVRSNEISPRDLLTITQGTTEGVSAKTLREATDEFQKEFILKKLAENDWNKAKTADALGIARPNLYRKLKELGIEI